MIGCLVSHTSSYIDLASVGDVRPSEPARAWRRRLVAATAGACCLGLLGLAAEIRPHESGVGTHGQLGLPACSFLAETGWPCPTCGLTTSVSAMAHGRVGLAWRAHPFGVVLFVALAVLAAAASAEAVSGWRVLRRCRLGIWAWAALLGLPAAWGLKMLCGAADGSLPVR